MNERNDTEGFILIVWVWNAVIQFLSRISVFDIVRRSISFASWEDKRKYLFVDIWVLAHTLLSVLSIIIMRYSSIGVIKQILFYYGILRVFEIFIYQLKINLLDNYEENATLRSYRRSILLLIHNFMEIIFWFTASYEFLMNWFDVADRSTSLIQAFYMSFVTMTTFGPPNFNIDNNPAMVIIMIQSVLGLFMTVVSIARFISMLPTPKSQVLIENRNDTPLS
ncbi:ion channel [Paenibacillus sp. P32E]|uniref:ion channel n=1 Tax=Paenibacillus sp. P32E TaxID=1349434 RepID=UPI0009397087|nr:ion channel [Paenibacillus sp. P32E]OKP82182.1 hypothetical protein A3848_29675 [Paenibacillus sp. P32E]